MYIVMSTSCVVQPSYPSVLPLWTSECEEPYVVELLEELNASDEAAMQASHPVREEARVSWGCVDEWAVVVVVVVVCVRVWVVVVVVVCVLVCVCVWVGGSGSKWRS